MSCGGVADTDGPENLQTFALSAVQISRLSASLDQRVLTIFVAYCVSHFANSVSLYLSISAVWLEEEPQTSRRAEAVGQSRCFE